MSDTNKLLLTKRSRIWLLVGILFIAVNLRPALSSIGPLIDFIRQSFDLSDTLLGLLTTLPLLAFGVISTITPLFTNRFGIGKTLLGAMILLIVGILIRSSGSIIGLYVGTILLGIAIAFGNVLLPALTKQNFPEKAGSITSLYSATMSLGASLAAGLSVPIADRLGWQGSMATWSLLALLAFFIWIPQIKRIQSSKSRRSFRTAIKKMSGIRLVWELAFFMGLQSFTFYVLLAWLPDLLIARDYDFVFAGWMLSLSQATGIIGALIVPFWAGHKKDQRLVIVLLVLLEIIGLAGLMFPQIGMVAVWVSILGLVLGGTFGLALLLIVLRSSNTETAGELSGMVQSIGYIIAATGPFLIGFIQDLFKIWNYSLSVLIVLALVKLYVGMGAGKAQEL